MSSIQRVAFSVVVAVAFPFLAAAPSSGEVVGIEVINFTDGVLEFAETPFFVPADPNNALSHLTLATLHLPEIINDPSFPPGSGGPGDPTDPNDPTDDGEFLWWDVEIKVSVDPSQLNPNTGQPNEPVMLAIDKDVFNNTDRTWTDFHMTLGMGLGDQFMESDEFDFLFFKPDPPPIEKTGAFPPAPMKMDEPVAPDSLWWFAGENYPGVPPGGVPVFWLGIQIPPEKFMPSPTGAPGMAVFTLRQHASVPEPTTIVLAGLALALYGARRRA